MTRSRWIVREAPAEAPAPAEDLDVAATGPTRPAGTVPAPDAVDRLRTRQAVPLAPGHHWYLGAHGGAGESTLAALDPHGHDARHVWPLHPEGHRVVLVARETVRDVTRLQQALRHWASGELTGVQLLGVVTIPAAPGRADKAVRDLLHRVTGGAPRHWRFDWHPVFHTVLDPHDAPAPRGLTRITRSIHTLSEGAPE